MYEPERRIAVEWSAKPDSKQGKPGTYPVKITVHSDDRVGMLKQLTAAVSDDDTNIRNIEVKTENGDATIDVVADIYDVKHLERIMKSIRKITGVREVSRMKKL